MIDIRFLESTDNIKKIIKETTDYTPNTEMANEISACLQQGRLFFESAKNSSAIIKPVELYYGIVAFSAALYIAKSHKRFSDIPPTHGIKSNISDPIESSTIKILNAGTFQVSNDITCNQEGIHYFGNNFEPLFQSIPFTNSSKLSDTIISLKEIFARVPSLENIYKKTFDEESQLLSVQISHEEQTKVTMQIVLSGQYKDKEGLQKQVAKLRTEWPFLDECCLIEAQLSWGKTYLTFENLDKKTLDEFTGNFLSPQQNLSFMAHSGTHPTFERFDIFTRIPPVFGALTDEHVKLVKPVSGHYISEYSLFALGIYALSSLARYHPDKWVNVVSYKAASLTAIIEEFMEKLLKIVPEMVIKIFHTKL